MRYFKFFFIFLFSGSNILFSQPSKLWPQHRPQPAKAVVVGVSHYQDAEIPDLKYAHHDAENFASFLMSPGGGGLGKNDLRLLTNDQATSARFAAALEWLFEEMADGPGIIYFAGYGSIAPQSNQFPGYFLMNDSPMSPTSAGAFHFPEFVEFHAKAKWKQLTIIANTYPLLLPPDIGMQAMFSQKQPTKNAIQPGIVKNTVTQATYQSTPDEIATAKVTLNHLLLNALLGLADRNKNGTVTMRECGVYLKNQQPLPETWPSQLAIAYPDQHDVFAVVDDFLLKKLGAHADGFFPAIVHLETTESEDALLKTVAGPVRLQYQEFVVALKLGRLLDPPGECAASLYDSLVQVEALQSLHGNLRRKLAAALQDETQQALNAYLRTDIRHILHRNKDERYRLYPQYLEKALALMGEKHFLRNMILVKQHYFQGLLHRFDAVQNKDTNLLRLALRSQELALELEPDAAFVVNEVGVLYDLMGQGEMALTYFKSAAELAPNWSVPFSNICYELGKAGKHLEAIEAGKQAVRLSPRNVVAFNNLGTVLSRSGQETDAEKAFVRAISLDPAYPETYFNLACLNAKLNKTGLALEWLEQSLQKGLDETALLRSDADMAFIRQQPQYEQLIKKYLGRE